MTPATCGAGRGFALTAGLAESSDGPACGGAVRAGRPEFSTASLPVKGAPLALRIASGDGLAAALDSEPRRPCAPYGAVAGQAPPPGGRPDRPTPNLLEASVNAIDVDDVPGRLVDPADLICPGCGEPAVGQPPLGWPAAAGRCPEFSHADGSVLCPDSMGRVGEPVEVATGRFRLTEAGALALDAAEVGS